MDSVRKEVGDRGGDAALHGALIELDRLEELIEEMDELAVGSRAEAEARLAELHRRLDGTSGG